MHFIYIYNIFYTEFGFSCCILVGWFFGLVSTQKTMVTPFLCFLLIKFAAKLLPSFQNKMGVDD
jgi:hypothetical protein